MSDGSPRKSKRTAEHQINKDNDPEGDGEAGEEVAGTFQRASADVLKTRRIVKAGRALRPSADASPEAIGFPSVPPTANPFQKLVLKPSESKEGGGSGSGVASASVAASTAATNGSSSSSGDGSGGGSGGGSVAVSEGKEAGAAATTADGSEKDNDEGKKDEVIDGATGQAPGTPAAGVPEVGEASTKPQAVAGDTKVEVGSPKEEAPEQKSTPPKVENGSTREDSVTSAVGGNGVVGAGKEVSDKAGSEGAAAGGVVSFAALGGGGSGGAFQSLLKGANTSGAPLSFAGFGSSPATLPVPSSTASFAGKLAPNSTGSAAPAGGSSAIPAPTLSFGAPLGNAAFSSFTSFATAPAGATWGISAKGAGDDAKGGEGSSATDAAQKATLGLMDPSDVVNGEEEEDCTLRARAKLFRLNNKEWVEMGIGNMKVLRKSTVGPASKEAGKAAEGGDESNKDGNTKGAVGAAGRLVMRRETGHQVMLNVSLQEQTRIANQGEKALLLSCFTPEGPATYLLKVKTPEDAGSLKAAVEALLPSEAA